MDQDREKAKSLQVRFSDKGKSKKPFKPCRVRLWTLKTIQAALSPQGTHTSVVMEEFSHGITTTVPTNNRKLHPSKRRRKLQIRNSRRVPTKNQT